MPGQTYTIQVQNVTNDFSRAAWGFELTSLTPSNTVAGTFANTTTFTRTRTGGGRNYIEQTAAGAFPGQTGGSSWTFDWTAPSTDVGAITFYAAGLQADNSGDESGDQTYTTSAAVPVGGAHTDTNTDSNTDACYGKHIGNCHLLLESNSPRGVSCDDDPDRDFVGLNLNRRLWQLHVFILDLRRDLHRDTDQDHFDARLGGH